LSITTPRAWRSTSSLQDPTRTAENDRYFVGSRDAPQWPTFHSSHLALNDRLDVGSVALQVTGLHGQLAQDPIAQERNTTANSYQQGARTDQTDLSFDIDLPPGINNSDNLAGLPLDQIDHLLDRLNDAQHSMRAIETQSTQQRDSLIARLESLESQVQFSDPKLSRELPYTKTAHTELDQLATENARLESRVAEFEELLVEYEQRLEEQRCRAEIEAAELMGDCARYKSSLDDSVNAIGKLQNDCDTVEGRLRELGEQSETEIERLRVHNEFKQEEFARGQQQIETRLASLHALVDKRDGEIQSQKNEQRKQRTEFEKELATSEINLSHAQDRLVRVENEAAEKVAQAQRDTEQAQAEFNQDKQAWQASQQLALQLQKQSQENVVALLKTETEATELKSNIAHLEDQIVSQQDLFNRKEVSLEQTLQDVLGEVESLQSLSQSQQLELDAQSARYEETHRELEADRREFQRQAEQYYDQVEQLKLTIAEEKEALKQQQDSISEQELSARNAIVAEFEQQIERLQSNNETLNQHLIKTQEEADQVPAALAAAKNTEQAAEQAIGKAELLAQELEEAKQATLDAEKAAEETRLEIEQVRSNLAAAQDASRNSELALEEAQKRIAENGTATNSIHSDAEEVHQPAPGSEPPTGGRYPTMPAVIAPQTDVSEIQSEADGSQLDLTTEDTFAAPKANEIAEPAEDSQLIVNSDDPYAAYNNDYKNEPAGDVCSNPPTNSFGISDEESDNSSWGDDDNYSLPNSTDELADEETEEKLSDFAKSLLDQLETPDENQSDLNTNGTATPDDYDQTTDYDKLLRSENNSNNEFADDYDADFSNEQLSNEQLSNEQLSNEQLSNEQLSNEERLLEEAQSTVNEMAEHTAFQTRTSEADELDAGQMGSNRSSSTEIDYGYEKENHEQEDYKRDEYEQDELDDTDDDEQEKTGPISAADALARMGHTFDDPDTDSTPSQTPSAPAPSAPAPSAPAPSAPAPSAPQSSAPHSPTETSPNAAWGNKPKEGGGEDDDSIDEYMARLLQRVRGDDELDEEDSGTSNPTSTAPGQNGPTMEQRVVEQPPVEEEQAPLTAEEFKPSRRAPEANSNLSAMRELANSSARTAITTSNRKKGMRITLTFMALTVISISFGLGLLLCTFLMQSVIIGAVALAFLGFSGFAGWKTHGLWKTYFVTHTGPAKTSGPRSSNHDDDGVTPLYEGD
jgi:hypothetical protein